MTPRKCIFLNVVCVLDLYDDLENVINYYWRDGRKHFLYVLVQITSVGQELSRLKDF